MTIYADSPDIAKKIIKCHKEANKMDREQEILSVTQGLIDLVKIMQAQLDKLTCEVTELRSQSVAHHITLNSMLACKAFKQPEVK